VLVVKCYVFNAFDVAGNPNSFADLRSTEVLLDQLHLFCAQAEFEKLGALRTTKQHQLVFRFGGYMNIDFRGTSKEATRILAHIVIEPYCGRGGGENVDVLYQIGIEYGFIEERGGDCDPRLVLAFEIPFMAIGDPIYGRMMWELPPPKRLGWC
jgi:hypothetical protein